MLRLAAPLVAALLAADAAEAPRKKIERAAQLPQRTYQVDVTPSALITDAKATDALIAAVRKDLEADLRDYDIQDKATLRSYYGSLTNFALMQGRLDDALALSAKVTELQERPALKLLSGVALRSMVAAKRAPAGKQEEVFAAAFRRELASVPHEQVAAELKNQKAALEVLALEGYVTTAEQRIDRAVRGGTLAQGFALAALGMAYSIREVLPRRDAMVKALQETIAAHEADKPAGAEETQGKTEGVAAKPAPEKAQAPGAAAK